MHILRKEKGDATKAKRKKGRGGGTRGRRGVVLFPPGNRRKARVKSVKSPSD